LGEVLREARRYLDRARSHASAIDRGDEFLFGEQRELREEIDRLSEDVDRLMSVPVRLARDARERAQSADDPAERAELLELAYQRYRTVEATDVFCQDGDDLAAAATTVGDTLVLTLRELARVRWNEGTDRKQADDLGPAMDRWADAIEHLERAEELASELDHREVAQVEAQRERLEQTLAKMRETADQTGETPGRTGGETDAKTPSHQAGTNSTPGTLTLDDRVHRGSHTAGDSGDSSVAPDETETRVPEKSGGATNETVNQLTEEIRQSDHNEE
ncbi:MAG: hypothetical protein BRD41_00830, partial [Bacteroidetes bacterium QS_1_63_11]